MTIAQQLNIKDFPFVIKDKNGKEIYYENSTGEWSKKEYDANDKEIYFENSNGYWCKCEYDAYGKLIYFEKSDGFWYKCEYDANGYDIRYEESSGYWRKSEWDTNGKEIYYENSTGHIKDNRPKQNELPNSESIEEWEIKITSLVEDYKQLTACCDAAYYAGVLDAEGKLYTAIWNTYDNMLEHIDVAGWISWYIFDNGCGTKEMEAGYGDEINTIKTPLDLARLIVTEKDKLKQKK
jgi:hypothetical protein